MTPFLTAEWRHLLMINYEIQPAVLLPFVPHGTEIDDWNGKTYVSMVGFLFLKTRVLGLPIPFHMNFEEVNLRFYVRRKAEDGWRRGVVFVKEIVPRVAIAAIARWLYHEKYVSFKMQHSLNNSVEYRWLFDNRWNSVRAIAAGELHAMRAGSIEEFIAEHYWGYSAQPNGSTVEYRVEHPRWRIRQAENPILDCRVRELYGDAFADPLGLAPASAFIAEGSAISVYRGMHI